MDDKNNLEEQLLKLALEIKNCNAKAQTLQRRKLLQKFLTLLHENRDKYKPRGNLPAAFRGNYEEICSESYSLLALEIHREIDKYDPSRASVLNWVRMLINRRCFHEAIKNIEDPIFSKKNRSQDPTQSPYLHKRKFSRQDQGQEDGRDTIPDKEENSPLLSEQIRSVIEADPKGEFKAACVENNPQANFQRIALWRCEHAKAKWDLLAEQLSVKVPTLSSFYRRKIKKFAPKIKQYILENAL